MDLRRFGAYAGTAGRTLSDLTSGSVVGMRQAVGRETPGTPAGRLARAISVAGLALLAVAVLLGVVGLLSGHGQPKLLVVVAGVVAPLVVASRLPLWGWRLGWLAAVLVPALPHERAGDPVAVCVLAVVFAIAAARYGRPLSWVMWAASLVPGWVWVGVSGWRGSLAASVALTVVAVLIDATSGWHRTRIALRTQAARTETEMQRRAVLEERTRIAREMHDVVAHNLSLIAVQTTTAPYRLGTVSDEVREEFESLNRTARAALDDARDLVGALRDDASAERDPQPRLADITDLVAASRRAGVQIELRLPADIAGVRAIVAASAYRIVQESLSNVARHADGAAVQVHVDRTPERICIQVRNSCPAVPPALDGSPGFSLRGMRERVALVGGSVSASRTRDGGFLVAAMLPTGERVDD